MEMSPCGSSIVTFPERRVLPFSTVWPSTTSASPSDEPVAVKLLNGTLDSDRLRIIDKGDVVRFEGNVRMNLVMEQPNADANNPPQGTSGENGSSGGNEPVFNLSQDPEPLSSPSKPSPKPSSSKRSFSSKHGGSR